MAYRTYTQEVAFQADVHDKLEQRIKGHLNSVDSLKDNDSINYYEYYLIMCNFFNQYDHDTTFCQRCTELESMGRSQLKYIERTHCNI